MHNIKGESIMVLKVASYDRFQFKIVPSIKNLCFMRQSDVHYIGAEVEH